MNGNAHGYSKCRLTEVLVLEELRIAERSNRCRDTCQ
jgi:hypothetical protein